MKDTISILEDEHRHIVKALEDIERTTNKDNSERDINIVKRASHLFIEANKHHEREEKVLFPAVEEKGFDCAPRQMVLEHDELKKLKKELKEAADKEDWNKIKNIVDKLVPMLREHIWKEDNILYPTARTLLSKKEIEDLRKDFDKIGYCCFHPVK